MISTLTSLLSRAEPAETETEDSDDAADRATDGGVTVAPDLTVAEADVTAPDDAEDPIPDRDEDPVTGTEIDGESTPDTDWEFISGMVDQAVSEPDESADAPSPAVNVDRAAPADSESQSEPEDESERETTAGAGPLAGIDPDAIDTDAVPILEAERPFPGAIDEPGPEVADQAPAHPRPDEDTTTAPADQQPDESSVLEALFEELETTDLSDEERLALREALGVSSSTSVELRLRHLQADVADLRAYADAIERVLDEESEADRLARDLGRRIDGLRDRLDDTLATFEDDLAAETEAREAAVERLETRIAGVATTLTDSVVALHHDVEDLRQDVEDTQDWREDVTAAFATDD